MFEILNVLIDSTLEGRKGYIQEVTIKGITIPKALVQK